MLPARRALIVGGGIAGLSAAIALRHAGYRVTIFERATAIAPAGAALSLWPNALAALQRLGAAARIEAEATPITNLVLADRAGAPIFGPQALPAGQAFIVTRALLQAALIDLLSPADLRLACAVDDVSQDVDGVTLTLADGSRERGDVAVIADGIWSPTATALLGNAPAYCGYGGVLALSDAVTGNDTSGIAAEYHGDGERFGVFDIGGERRYWFHMCDMAGPHEAGALSIVDLAARAGGWPDAVRQAVVATPAGRLLPFAIHARPAPQRLGRGRILVVGDAAHAMEPNLGQGACQALEDAVALGAIASCTPPGAMLAAYERLRLRRIGRFVRQSAGARHGAHGNRVKQHAVRAVLRAVPRAIERRVLAWSHRMPDY